MAIYHFSGQIISRSASNGRTRSAIACAAYRSGEKLFDERGKETKYYKRDIEPVTKILAPKNSPDWVYDREALWNEVEKIEKRYDAQLAREFNIALPVELKAEEQEKLAYEFCQKAFVDKGMVADICIHNDTEENTHFHVMLTIRPFEANGAWGAKSKESYSFDIDGNRIRQKNGRYKSVKVATTDWNKKDTMKEWRKEWEVMTNNVLKSNGIDARITCESNENLGNEKFPTIHEGYVAREMERNGKESDRINQNKLIKDYNNTVGDLRNYKEEKQENEDHKNFYRSISPDEKRILKNAAKELKLYINYDNVTNRLEQLKRWQKSLSFQAESLEKTKKLNRLGKEEELLFSVSAILETESDRFIQKNYMNLDLDTLNIDEKIQIVNDTIKNKKVLNTDELELVKGKVEGNNLRKSLNDILKNNSRFTMSVQSDIEHIMKTFNGLVAKYDIDFEKPETAKNAPIKIMADMKGLWNRQKDLTKALKIIDTIYDIKLKEMYPTWKGRLNLKIEEKELFILSEDYFGKTLMPDDFKAIPYKFSSKQQEEILNILDIKNDPLLKEKYPDFKINEAYKNMFYMECHSNTSLNKASKKLVDDYFSKDNFMQNYKVFEAKDNDFVSSNKGKSLLFEVIENVINEIDTRVKEDKFEKDRLKKKSQKLKQKRQRQDLEQ
ncbi:MAG TPA: MobQ family relaxase [Desulfosporosinus sp.]|nr:MobQ family relaxase [Desulfosporosinus sp.]